MTQGDYLALLAHELRGSLGAIGTAAHVLRACDPASRDAAEAHEVLERQSHQAMGKLEELLALGRIVADGPAVSERVDLVALMREQRRMRVEAELGHLWLQTDRGALEDALSRTGVPAWTRVRIEAGNGTAGVLTMEPVAGGVAVHVVRALLECAGAQVRLDVGAEGRRLVAELPR